MRATVFKIESKMKMNELFPYTLKALRHELETLGMKPGMRLLPPRVVKFLVDRFCIDVQG